MSTHAAIIQHTEAGDYRGTYLHYDGYPDHAGRILGEHYTSDEAVAALIDLGDLSGIGSTPEKTIAYHRNYGEAKKIRASEHLESVADRIDWHYLYLWEGGEWVTFKSHAELRDELAQRQAWEIEQAETEAGWDPAP
jgi:hypothetical protein